MISDNIWMIQMPESEVSQYYVNKVLPSWKKHGFEVNMFDAVTAETLHLYDDIKIDQYHGKRDFTPSEMGCWYSHYLLWEKCGRRQTNHGDRTRHRMSDIGYACHSTILLNL